MARELSESDVYVLLGKRRRRLLLRILREATTPVSVERLPRYIGNRERGTPSAADLKEIRLTLHHIHLPRLDDADVVEYDRDEGTVRPWLNFDPLVRVLESVDDQAVSWSDE